MRCTLPWVGSTALVCAVIAACEGSASNHDDDEPGTGGAPGVTSATSTGGDDASGGAGEGSGGASGSGGRVDDDFPIFTDEEWALLTSMAPDPLPPPPADVTNAWADDPAAAALGETFFMTPLFSGALLTGDNNGGPGTLGLKGESQKVACAGCHLPDDDFQDTRSPSQQISLGTAWGKRKAPSLLDIGQVPLVTWDGRRDTLYNQVFGPFEAASEMNSSRLFVAQQVFLHFRVEYEAVFGEMPSLDDVQRFPPVTPEETGCTPAGPVSQPTTCEGTWHGYPGDGAQYDSMSSEDQDAVTRVVVNVGKAIGAFERRLQCGPGRFDRWVQGDDAALSASEQRGAQVFIGEGRCVQCHAGPYFSDQAFHNVGLAPALVASSFYDTDDPGAAVGLAQALDDPLNSRGAFSDGDDGRLPEAVSDEALGAFRTPMLRCVARRPAFMHTGQFLTLAAVVDFFDQGGHPGGYLGESVISPLQLDETEKDDLVAFLRTLDGPLPSAAIRRP